MPKSERYNTILSLLNERGYLSVEELSRMIYVSPSTLRRDLAEMSRSGYIKRSWGGVMALTPSEAEDAVVHQESASLTPEQAAIAQAAAKYLREDDVTYLDASGLVLGMIPMIKNMPRLTLVTNSLRLPMILPEGRHRLFSLAGELASRSLSLTGSRTMESAAQFNYRIAFFSCSGISKGFATCNTAGTAMLMRTVLAHSAESALLCTRDKAQRVTAINAVPLSRFDHIITDVPELFRDYSEKVVAVS